MGVFDTFPGRYFPVASDARLTIPHAEANIDAGMSWETDYEETVGASTAVTVMWTAPSSGAVELVPSISADKAVSWVFSEAPNASGGSSITAHNHNRQSSSTDPIATVVSAITFTSSGTMLQEGSFGTTGGQGNPASGGAGGLDNKWILATAQSYLMRVVAAGASTTIDITGHYDLNVHL